MGGVRPNAQKPKECYPKNKNRHQPATEKQRSFQHGMGAQDTNSKLRVSSQQREGEWTGKMEHQQTKNSLVSHHRPQKCDTHAGISKGYNYYTNNNSQNEITIEVSATPLKKKNGQINGIIK